MWEEGGQKRQEAKQAKLRRQEKEEMPVASVPRVGRSSGKLDERGVSRISIRIGSVRIWSHQSFVELIKVRMYTLVWPVLRKTSIEKKRFLSGIARMMREGVNPCPNFLALFQGVHFWSIKRVYFFKNANVLNF